MEHNLKKEIEQIISNINPSWSLNGKIRYIYLNIGKMLTKDVKFFYTLFGKIGNNGYSYEEMKQMIDNNNIDDYNYSVFCKSASNILKYAFDKIGIDSEVINTINYTNYQIDENKDSTVAIYHYFLVVTGNENKKYFMSLIPDLMNIQFGLETEHFAQDIFEEHNKKVNDKIYEGKKIENSSLTREQICELDKEINFLKPTNANNQYTTYNNDLINLVIYQWQPIYNSLLLEETSFFTNAFKYRSISGDYINLKEHSISEISKEELLNWVKYLKILVTNSNLDKNELQTSLKYCDVLNNTIENAKDNKSLNEKRAFGKKIHSILKLIGMMYVNKNYLYNLNEKEVPCTTEYINKKFSILFPYIFGCESFSKTDDNSSIKPITSVFKGHAEIANFINTILEKLFPEINNKNSSHIFEVNSLDKTSAVEKRIKKISIINKLNATYSFIFSIDDKFFYFFNPNRCEFSSLDDNKLFNIATDYIIIGDKLKNRIDVENMDIGKKLN